MSEGKSRSLLVDVHVHLYPGPAEGRVAKDAYVIWEYGDDPGVSFSDSDGDLDDLSRVYQAAGFDHAVVLQLFDTDGERTAVRDSYSGPLQLWSDAAHDLDAALAEGMRRSNRWVTDVCATDPRLVPFVGIDPTLLDAAGIREHLLDMAAAGARGVKLHPVSHRFFPDDDRLDAVYSTCSETGLVVLSHSGPGHRGMPGADPARFATVLDRHPTLRLVLAHLGGASWPQSVDLAEAYPQVTFDLSEIIEWHGSPMAPSRTELAAVVQRIGADRVMLGSDYPWYDPERSADMTATLPGIGAGEQEALLGGTAAGLLGLSP